jgi:hypothetical protein
VLYVAAILAPQIAFAWLRRPWWTAFSILILPLLAVVTVSIAWWVVAAFAIKAVAEYKTETRQAEVRAVIAATV